MKYNTVILKVLEIFFFFFFFTTRKEPICEGKTPSSKVRPYVTKNVFGRKDFEGTLLSLISYLRVLGP
jgi:hypothetical protein